MRLIGKAIAASLGVVSLLVALLAKGSLFVGLYGAYLLIFKSMGQGIFWIGAAVVCRFLLAWISGLIFMLSLAIGALAFRSASGQYVPASAVRKAPGL